MTRSLMCWRSGLALGSMAALMLMPRETAAQEWCSHRAERYAYLEQLKKGCKDSVTDDARRKCLSIVEAERAKLNAMFAQCSIGGGGAGAPDPGGDVQQSMEGILGALKQRQDQDAARQAEEARQQAERDRAVRQEARQAQEEADRERLAQLDREARDRE